MSYMSLLIHLTGVKFYENRIVTMNTEQFVADCKKYLSE